MRASRWIVHSRRNPSAILLSVQLLGMLVYPFIEGAEAGRIAFGVFGITGLSRRAPPPGDPAADRPGVPAAAGAACRLRRTGGGVLFLCRRQPDRLHDGRPACDHRRAVRRRRHFPAFAAGPADVALYTSRASELGSVLGMNRFVFPLLSLRGKFSHAVMTVTLSQ